MVRWALALACVLLLAACTGDGPEPAPMVSVAPSPTARRLEPGTTVEMTAVTTKVLGWHAILVTDANLPVGGQLVVSDSPIAVRVTDLVTIAGRVEMLDAGALNRYGVTAAQVIESSDGVVVVATSVRWYPAASSETDQPSASVSPR